MNYLVATTKSWNIENFKKLEKKFPKEKFYLISKKEELTLDFLSKIKPKYIFFPHWSWIIPNEIFESFDSVVFHMTDLPFGRGGSPLQNLIVRGIYDTKISAIKVEEGLDTGPIYFKYNVNISEGNVADILSKVSEIIFFTMIPRFINEELVPHKQEGEAVVFKRRKPSQSEIPEGLSTRQLYDYIRMLDGEGYPTAYKDVGDLRIYFKNAKLEQENLTAEVNITRR